MKEEVMPIERKFYITRKYFIFDLISINYREIAELIRNDDAETRNVQKT